MIYSVDFITGRDCLVKTEGLSKRKDNKFYIDKELIFSKEDRLSVKIETLSESFNTYYIANYIKTLEKSFIIKEFLLNDSSKFILPLIMSSKLVSLFNTNFINIYIKSYHIDHELGEIVHIVQRYVPFEYYHEYVTCIKTFDEFHSITKSKDKRFDIISLKVLDNKIKDSIKKIIKGKFLELDLDIKERITKFNKWNKKNKNYKMLYNDPEYRKEYEDKLNVIIPDYIACRSKPNLKIETYD